MKSLIAIFCLTIAVLIGNGGVGYAQDGKKGIEAYKSGDYATAMRELRPLAEQGNAVLQHLLGQFYRKGQGVTQDFKEAVKWYRKSAEQGDAYGQLDLGLMYWQGDGVRKDYVESMKWFRKSAEQGLAYAQFRLGMQYENGNSGLQDNVYAQMWFIIAASNDAASDDAELFTRYRELFTRYRDFHAKRMTPAQIAKAQKLARECVKKNYKGC